MVVCPSCRFANSPKSRFCIQCGGKLEIAESLSTDTAVEDQFTLPEGVQAMPRAEKIQLPSEKPRKTDAPAPLPESRAPSVKVEVKRPPLAPPEEAPIVLEPESAVLSGIEKCPVRLSLNFNRVFVEENPSTFEAEVENCSPLPIENVEVRLESSRALGRPLRFGFKRLAPAQKMKRLLEVEPQRAGNFVMQGAVTLESQGERLSFVASRALRVNAVPDANIVINISDIQSNRSSGANAGLGQEYGNVNISNLVDSKTIRTLNDLIELELKDNFDPLDLELDYQLSLDSLTIAEKRLEQTVSIPRAFLHVAKPGLSLKLTPDSHPDDTLTLISRPLFRIGRSRQETDFASWFWPRTAANDEKTKRISKVQVIGEVRGGAVFFRDSGSSNGSTYNGVTLDAEHGLPIDRRGLLSLATEYTLDVLHGPSRFEKRAPSISNINKWSGPAEDNSPRLGAVRFLPTVCELTPFHSVWLLSDGEFGTSNSNSVIIRDENLAEIQGRFFHYRGCYWLENAVDNGAISIDDHILDAGAVAPLTSGQRLSFGKTTCRVEVGE